MSRKFIIFLLAQYLVVCVELMFLYKGGSLFDTHYLHYVLDQNYLSDLGRTFYFSNQVNPLWFVYSITLFLVGLGTALFFKNISVLIDDKLRFWVQILGLISGLAYIGIAIFPVDIYFKEHIVSGQIAYFSFFFAFLLFSFLIDRKVYSRIFNWSVLLTLALFVFLLLGFFGPHSNEGVWALQIKTLSQKVMISLQIFVSIYLLFLRRNINV